MGHLMAILQTHFQYQKLQLLQVIWVHAVWFLNGDAYHSLVRNKLASCYQDLELVVQEVVLYFEVYYWLQEEKVLDIVVQVEVSKLAAKVDAQELVVDSTKVVATNYPEVVIGYSIVASDKS